MKRFVIIAIALAVAVPLTRLAGRLTIDSIRSHVAEHQTDELEEAIAWIKSDFVDIQTDLLLRARAVADDPDARFLVDSEFSGLEPTEEVERAITRFHDRHAVSGPISVELYGENMALRAWSGESFLPKPEPDSVKADMVVRIEQDPFTRAVALWVPIGRGGLVRAARAIQTTAFENFFPGNSEIAETWRDETGLRLELSLDERGLSGDDPRFDVVPLLNSESRVLGTVIVSRSSGEGLIRSSRRRYEDVEAFWWILLLFWIAAGSWSAIERRQTNHRSSLGGLLGLLISRITILVGIRYVLLILDVPGRWFQDSPLEVAFDPVFLASEVSWGIARSVGDLAVTGLFLFAGSLTILHAASRYQPTDGKRSIAQVGFAAVSVIALISTTLIGHAELTRQSVFDATLDFFAWTGLSPQPLVLVVFCALLLSTIATVVVGVSCLIWLARWSHLEEKTQSERPTFLVPVAGSLVSLTLVLLALDLNGIVPWWVGLSYVAAMLWPAYL